MNNRVTVKGRTYVYKTAGVVPSEILIGDPRTIPTTADTRLCITIRQPWAWLILRPDLTPAQRAQAHVDGLIKDIENRPWKTSRRGWLYIHAGKVIDHAAIETINREFVGRIVIPPAEQLQTGGIVGRVNLHKIDSYSMSVWAMDGKQHWHLSQPEPLPFEPMRGMQGLFQAGSAKR